MKFSFVPSIHPSHCLPFSSSLSPLLQLSTKEPGEVPLSWVKKPFRMKSSYLDVLVPIQRDNMAMRDPMVLGHRFKEVLGPTSLLCSA